MTATDRPISLSQFLIEEQREHGHITADLRLLIEVVARTCKVISIAVGKGALGQVLLATRYPIEAAQVPA